MKAKEIVRTYSFLVPSPIVRGKRTSEHAHSKGHDEIQQPKPTKQMIDLHSKQISM